MSNSGILIPGSERMLVDAVSRLTWANPFLPERVSLERKVLGARFDDAPEAWNMEAVRQRDRMNLSQITHRVEPLLEALRGRLAEGAQGSDADLLLYEDVVCFFLYHKFRGEFTRAILESQERTEPLHTMRFADEFQRSAMQLLQVPGRRLPSSLQWQHVFACCFQIRRAFVYIFNRLASESRPAAHLRAEIWRSIFTHDLGRYVRSRYRQMGDIPTLITGPSGTGKELVAQAIGYSRYIPYDTSRNRFVEDYASSFFPLDISALSPTLVESELFGHRRGAFTGAVSDRVGWFEACPDLGTVFLDEIGEVEPAIQVKLLRVLQTRTFYRLGESAVRQFRGKIISATNRNLAEEIRAGRFREDFYYRLCADTIRTPSLREQLVDTPDALRGLVLFIARRLARDEAESVAEEVCKWIDSHLGRDYPWPGNIRELEQCIRSIWLRHEYRPAPLAPQPLPAEPREALAESVQRGSLSLDELTRRYVTLVYSETGSYEETAQRLGVNWRTVKAKVDESMLHEFGAG